MASMNCSFHDEDPTTNEALARCTNLSTVFDTQKQNNN
jgi:hypothetical protein